MKKRLVFSFANIGGRRIKYEKGWSGEILPVGLIYLPFGDALRAGIVDISHYDESANLLTIPIVNQNHQCNFPVEDAYIKEKMEAEGWTKIS